MTKPSQPQSRSVVAILVATAFSTTWRMFVPILGGVAVGILLDRQLSTAPVMTVIGLVIGVVVSTMLVLRQLKVVRETK